MTKCRDKKNRQKKLEVQTYFGREENEVRPHEPWPRGQNFEIKC